MSGAEVAGRSGFGGTTCGARVLDPRAVEDLTSEFDEDVNLGGKNSHCFCCLGN